MVKPFQDGKPHAHRYLVPGQAQRVLHGVVRIHGDPTLIQVVKVSVKLVLPVFRVPVKKSIIFHVSHSYVSVAVPDLHRLGIQTVFAFIPDHVFPHL